MKKYDKCRLNWTQMNTLVRYYKDYRSNPPILTFRTYKVRVRNKQHCLELILNGWKAVKMKYDNIYTLTQNYFHPEVERFLSFIFYKDKSKSIFQKAEMFRNKIDKDEFNGLFYETVLELIKDYKINKGTFTGYFIRSLVYKLKNKVFGYMEQMNREIRSNEYNYLYLIDKKDNNMIENNNWSLKWILNGWDHFKEMSLQERMILYYKIIEDLKNDELAFIFGCSLSSITYINNSIRDKVIKYYKCR